MESNRSSILLIAIIILSLINISLLISNNNQNTEYKQGFIELEDRIIQLQNALDEIEKAIEGGKDPDNISQEPVELKKDNFTYETLAENLNYTPVDLKTSTIIDPDNSLTIDENTLYWIKLKRDNDTRTYIEYNHTLTNIVYRFEFSITNFTYGEGDGRRLTSFWKICDHAERVEPTNFTHFYAQLNGHQNETYLLVFNQRLLGENQFVYISRSLNISQRYYATVVLVGDMVELAIHADAERRELVWSPGPQVLSENSYRFLLLCVTRDFGVDRQVWSSGYVSNLEVSLIK